MYSIMESIHIITYGNDYNDDYKHHNKKEHQKDTSDIPTEKAVEQEQSIKQFFHHDILVNND